MTTKDIPIKLNQVVKTLEERLEVLEGDFISAQDELHGIDGRVDELDSRAATFDNEVEELRDNNTPASLSDYIHNQLKYQWNDIKHVKERFDNLEINMVAIRNRLNDLDKQKPSVELRLEQNQIFLNTLRKEMDSLYDFSQEQYKKLDLKIDKQIDAAVAENVTMKMVEIKMILTGLTTMIQDKTEEFLGHN